MAALAAGWALEVANAEYLPVGGGSYHWSVVGPDGTRHFVTVDRLDQTSHLGETSHSAFEGLRRAFDTALALWRQGGLEFVVAPIPASGGETVVRLGPAFTIAVFPYVEGGSRGFNEVAPVSERAGLVRMLIRLHAATPIAIGVGRHIAPSLPGRAHLEAALGELNEPWMSGPLSEPTRELLAANLAGIRSHLAAFDRLLERVEAAGRDPVITHGEPHPGNVIRAPDGQLSLVDWDTAGMAPAERDLWMLSADELELYAEASGRRPDGLAIDLYRLRWTLNDIAIFTKRLRSPHALTADIEWAWSSLANSMPRSDPPA